MIIIIFFFKDRMNHLESQQKYNKKRLSTHKMHLVEMEKVYLRKRLLLISVYCGIFARRKIMVVVRDM